MINEDMKKIAEDYPETLLNDDSPVKNEPKQHTEELSREEKRLEKLNALKEKYGKARSAQEAAEKKTNSINAQIAKIEKEIHSEEDTRLTEACRKKNITYSELAEFIDKIPDNKRLSDLL